MDYEILVLSVLGIFTLVWIGLQMTPCRKKKDHLPFLLGMMAYFLTLVFWHLYFPAAGALIIVGIGFTVVDVLKTIEFDGFNPVRLANWLVNATLLIMLCLR
jgi:hypothetical protein